MSKKTPQEVYNKKKKGKKKDITIELDKFNVGRIPTSKGTKIIQGKKYNKKAQRKKSKMDLKKYIG